MKTTNLSNRRLSTFKGEMSAGQRGSSPFKGDTRGSRNNNPLNIRRSHDQWQGLASIQTDPQFFQFRTLTYGFRAAFVIIHTYMTKYGLCTPSQIISRWAPSSDNNNTAGYIAIVCDTAHMTPDQPLHFSNEDEMLRLVQAMAYVESGAIIAGGSIRQGYELALTHNH